MEDCPWTLQAQTGGWLPLFLFLLLGGGFLLKKTDHRVPYVSLDFPRPGRSQFKSNLLSPPRDVLDFELEKA